MALPLVTFKFKDGMVIKAHKVQFEKEVFRDLPRCVDLLMNVKQLHEFGIVGVVPPPGCAPEVFDILNGGAEGFKHLKDELCILVYNEQTHVRVAPHMIRTDQKEIAGKLTPAKFVQAAKMDGYFEPLSRNVGEAEQIHWTRMSNLKTPGQGDPSKPVRYVQTIDGSVFKTIRRSDGKLWDWDLSNPVGDIFTPTMLDQYPDWIVRGVMVSATFIGTAGSTFNGHWEDMDLLSFNKHWGGAFKIWYSVPLIYIHAFRLKLVEYLRLYEVEANVDNCEDVLRHKKYILEPEWFRVAGIPLVRLVQKPGEYVVTFPKGYHFGFNLGMNLNEAVNVATPESGWIDWGKFATQCTCENAQHGGFKSSMVPFVAEYQPDQLKDWLNGEGALFPAYDLKGALSMIPSALANVAKGAFPKVPPAPTFEDLVDMKNPPQEVLDFLQEKDPDGTERTALMQRRRKEEQERKRLKRIAPSEEEVIWTPADFKYSLFQSDQEVRENMGKRKAEMEKILEARLHSRQMQLGEVVEIE